ncbi:Ras-related protein Rab-3B [Camelus dromedarius]|uniref:small monomeric GTPase n=1 Tax=Camelus dromedarius TaxID=9838 RepID=A0A5N4DBE7_CAMDR|nr:Ras-related protein Rab-3B [Camelus dromedarius]
MASVTDGKAGVKDASDQNFDYMFKLLIIGNSSVGKTSFLFRYADDTFTPAFVSTVGIDFKVKTVYRHEKRVKLQIWAYKFGGHYHRHWGAVGDFRKPLSGWKVEREEEEVMSIAEQDHS